MKSNNVTSKNILFIDSQVQNYQALVENVGADTQVFILNSHEDGIEQISNVLANYSDIDSVQIISHGGAGMVQLGNTVLNNENLQAYSDYLQGWRNSLTDNADILFYGCNVGAGELGVEFLQQLGDLTGADIAGSNDLTGNSVLGGDWELEVVTGNIEAESVLAPEIRNNYQGVLAVFKVTNNNDSGAGSLRQAIIDAAKNNEVDTIDLTGVSGTIYLQNSLPTLSIGNDIYFIDDGNTTISGKKTKDSIPSSQIISVDGAKVTFYGLTFADGLARGGDGQNGGGGGLGAGGALFINSGNVTLDNVKFQNNKAQGGNATGTAGHGGQSSIIEWNGNASRAKTGGSGEDGGLGGTLNVSNANFSIPSQFQLPSSRRGDGYTDWYRNGESGYRGADGNFGEGGSSGGGGGAGGYGKIHADSQDHLYHAGNGGAGGHGGFGGGGGGGGGAAGIVIFKRWGDDNTFRSGGAGVGGVGGVGGTNYGGTGAIGQNSTPNTSSEGAANQSTYGKPGGQGGGGAGLGGAIFVRQNATLSHYNTNFIPGTNMASGGTGNTGGEAEGNTIFAMTGATNKTLSTSPTDSLVNPLVSITKSNDLKEGDVNNSNGEFLIKLNRDGLLANNLLKTFNLYFRVQGTAKLGKYDNTQKGSDYKLTYQGYDSLENSINTFKGYLDPSQNGIYNIGNIDENIQKIKITVEPVNDEIWEQEETVTITLVDNHDNNQLDGYRIGTTEATATVKITDNEPTVTLGEIVHPTEGFGFGSTIEGLGAALNLNGSNYITIPSNDSLDLTKTGQFTQEAWIFANLEDNDKTQRGILGYDNYPSIWVENQTTIKVGIVNNTFFVDNALNPNTWNHVATTFDGEEYKLYVNGVELIRKDIKDLPLSNTKQLTIGKVGDNNFIGAIDEVRLWDVARTQTEIQSYMLNPLKGSEQGLIGYWQFEGNLNDTTTNNQGVNYFGDVTNLAGTITASGENGTNEGKAKAFDDLTNTKWLVFANNGWLQYQFNKDQSYVVTEYKITSANDVPARDPKNWTLQGSNDGSNWTNLDTRNNETFSSRFQTRSFTLNNSTGYSYYRLNITANNGDSATQLAELQLFGVNYLENPAPQIGYVEVKLDKPFEGPQGLWVEYDITQQKEGQSLTFDGKDDYVSLPASSLGGAITVEAWVYVDNAKLNWQRVIDFGNGQANDNIVLAWESTTGKMNFTTYLTTAQGNQVTGIRTDEVFPDNKWVHVTAVNDGQGNAYIYWNGELKASGTGQARPKDVNRSKQHIGKSNWSQDAFFQGKIDELRIWNTARSQADIQNTMNQTLAGNEQGLVGYWQFDGDTQDKTSNKRNGTLVNYSTYSYTATNNLKNDDYFTSRTRRVSTNINTERNGIIIPKGETSARIYVSALSDAIVEGDEQLTIQLRPTNFDIFDANNDGRYSKDEYADSFENNTNFPTNADGFLSQTERDAIGYNYNVDTNNSTATITIKDNQAYQKGVILLDEYGQEISNSNKLIVDKNGNATFQVKLTSQPTSAVTLTLTSGLGALDKTSVTIQPSAWDTPQTVTVSGVTGTNVSNSITVSVPNYLTTNATFPFTNIPSDKVRITEGNPEEAEAVTPELTISKLNDVNESDIQPGQFVINLNAPAPAEGLTVNYQLAGSATSGTDYNSINTITVAPGETSVVIPIYPINDDIAEGDEQVTITLQEGTDYTLPTLPSQISATLNIIDDDKAGIKLSNAVTATSLSFDGINDRVTIPNSNGINFDYNQDFTVEAWIKVDPLQKDLRNGDNDIIEKWSGGGGYPFVIRYLRNSGQIQVARYDGSKNPKIISTTLVNDNQPHHVAFVKNGEKLSLYIDGNLDGETGDTTDTRTTNGSPLYIGSRNKGNDFKGEVDEIRIWNVARSQEEIESNKDRTLNSDEEGLVAYYPANEGRGTTLINSSDFDTSNGILEGGTSWNYEYTYTSSFSPLVTAEPYPEVESILQLFGEDGQLVKTITLTQANIDAGKVNIDVSKVNIAGIPANYKAILKEPNSPGNINLGTVTLKDNGTVDVSLPKNENTASFGIRLFSKPTENVKITFSNIDGTEGQFSKSSLDFTPENWEQYQSVTITGLDDTLVDGDIKYTVTAKASSKDDQYNNNNVSTPIIITNLDDDNGITKTNILNSSTGPKASIAAAPTTPITEGSQINLTVNLDEAAGTGGNLIFYSVDGKDFKYGEDYTVPATNQVYLKERTDGFELTPIDVNNLSGTKKDLDGDGDLDLVVTNGTTTTNYYQFQAVKIAQGQSSATITVNTIDDKVDETDETVKIALKAGTNYQVATNTDGSVTTAGFVNLTVQDNDTAGVTITKPSGTSTSENGSFLTYTVRLNSQPTKPVTVYIGSNDSSEGKINGHTALSFDGVDDYVSLPASNLGGAITVEAWVYVDDAKRNYQRIIDFGNGAAKDNILLAWEGTTGKMTFHTFNGSTAKFITTSEVFPDKQWVHVTAVNDGKGKAEIYWNGELKASGTEQNAPLNVLRTNQFIGKSNWDQDALFKGQIGEVRIWNVARSQKDIQDNKDKTLNGNETGLVDYYKADEGSGITLIDSAVNKSNGTLQGGTSWTRSNSEPSDFIGLNFNANNWNSPQTFQVVGINDDIADGTVPYNIITTVTSEDPNYNKLNINPIPLTNTEDSDPAKIDTAKIIITPPGQVEEGRENIYSVKLNSQPVGEIRVIMTPKVDQFQLNNEDIGEPLTLTFNKNNWNQAQTVRVTALDDSVVEYFQTSQIEFKVETGNIKDFESKWNNNTPDQGLDLGKITGGIERTGLTIDSLTSTDIDWYKFTLPTEGTAKDFVEIQFANAKGDLDLELYPNSSNLTFDGVDDYVKFASQVGGRGNFSIELWFKTTASSGTLIGAGKSDSWQVSLQNGLAKFDFQTGDLSGNGGISLTQVNDGKWHHLTAVRDGLHSGKLYVDGVLVSEFTYTGSSVAIDGVEEAFIGKNSKNDGNFFKGEIGEVRIWNTARSQQYIQDNKDRNLNGNEAGLVAYYPINEGTGDILTDSSVNKILADSTVNKLDGKLINGTIKNSRSTTENKERIELNGLAAGDYLLKVSGKDNTTSNDYKLILGDADYQYRTAPIETIGVNGKTLQTLDSKSLDVTIKDNDLPTAKIIAGPTASELFGEPSYFTVQLNAPAPLDGNGIVVRYEVVGGSATLFEDINNNGNLDDGEDFNGNGKLDFGDYRIQNNQQQGTVRIAPGEIQANIIISPVDDKLVEDIKWQVSKVKEMTDNEDGTTTTLTLDILRPIHGETTNIAAGQTLKFDNGIEAIFQEDIKLQSLSVLFHEINNITSDWYSISSDENLVAFRSDKDGKIYVHNRNTKVNIDVSVGDGLNPSISSDGSFVLFFGKNPNHQYKSNLFIYDRKENRTISIPTPTDDDIVDTGDYYKSNGYNLNSNGDFVVFQTRKDYKTDISVYDRKENKTTRITTGINGTESNGNSYDPSISADGRFVAFRSDASNLVPTDTNGKSDIFVYDRKENKTTRITTGGNDHSYDPSISADGRFVAFASIASNLVPNDTNRRSDIFVYDLNNNEITPITFSTDDTYYNHNNTFISDDGSFVVYSTDSYVFIYDRNTKTTSRFEPNLGFGKTARASFILLPLLTETVQVNIDSTFKNKIGSISAANMKAETVAVKLLLEDISESKPTYTLGGEDVNLNGKLDSGEDSNENGQLDPDRNTSKAILEILDDDVPGIRIVEVGRQTVVRERETATFEVSLLSEPTKEVNITLTPGAEIEFANPINPTTVQVDKDVYSFNTTGVSNLNVELKSLVFTDKGDTVAFDVKLTSKPTGTTTIVTVHTPPLKRN
ncbi:LamG-like jellyroll fold domain-containing protein [Dolichospermum sp. UHCC 0259]|uniref:LamG-like jellyroll fold domain-containing protein n=1 Tax=Dolichospermum sp. UHCC 0259 TaxID=2590010 RepID=UPI0014486597|nr:LamG-like jellyroll fold domain-containing protein [Dolichospermum sp. UHCC 0259]MTJ48840.1 DUF4347 domain-containing protein [Dolichospermum sp. UHCC 0259]